jgi:hypothetical protein
VPWTRRDNLIYALPVAVRRHHLALGVGRLDQSLQLLSRTPNKIDAAAVPTREVDAVERVRHARFDLHGVRQCTDGFLIKHELLRLVPEEVGAHGVRVDRDRAACVRARLADDECPTTTPPPRHLHEPGDFRAARWPLMLATVTSRPAAWKA